MAKNKKPRGWGKARVKLSGGGTPEEALTDYVLKPADWKSDPDFPVAELEILKNIPVEDVKAYIDSFGKSKGNNKKKKKQ
jgi:hypothetical protein|tara:strand:+ start:167 stop:406 length:240 start_codon:yes stop_codon:yes gene_type:complete